MKADTEAIEHPETHRLGLGPAPTGVCGPRTESPDGVATARLKESRYSNRRSTLSEDCCLLQHRAALLQVVTSVAVCPEVVL